MKCLIDRIHGKHEAQEKSSPKGKFSLRDHIKANFSSRHHDDDESPRKAVTETSQCLDKEDHGDGGLNKADPAEQCTEAPSSASVGESTQTLEELVMKGLWKEALESLREKGKRLVTAYEQDITRGDFKNKNQEKQPEESEVDRGKAQQHLVRQSLRELEDGKLFIPRRCRQTAISNHVQRIVHIIMSVKDVISQAISADPHASLAWAGVLVVLPLLLKPFTQPEEAAKGIEFISRLLIRYQVISKAHIQLYVTGAGKSEGVDRFCSSIREQTIGLYTQILEFQIRLARQFSHAGYFRGIRDLVTADDWSAMTNDIQQIDESIHTMLSEWSHKTIQHIDQAVSTIQENVDKSLALVMDIKKDMNIQHNENLLNSITCVTSATYGSYEQDRRTCLKGTQVYALEKIQEWSLSSEGKPILWFQGMAGTGKSTIARTAAAAFRNGTSLTKDGVLPDEICLGGTFFFDHKKQDCRDPRNVIPTLARQLVEVIPEIQDSVCAAISNHHNVQQRTLRDQWKYLIWEPLSMLQNDFRDTVVIVIDALDECEDQTNGYENDLELLLGLLSEVQELPSVRMRVLITSRPEADLQRHSKSLSQGIHDQKLEKIRLVDDSYDREDDITRLVKYEMTGIKKSHPSLPFDWPGTNRLRQLVIQTEGLFIYATTVCRFLRDATERTIHSRLEKILNHKFDGNSKGNSLNEMYTRILDIILTGEADNDEEMSILFKEVVGCIVSLSQPLSVVELRDLLPCKTDDIKWILGQLSSVIEAPQDDHEPVQLAHLSFRDFLLDPARCKSNLFSLNENEVNHTVFGFCLDLMSRYLRRDICGLRDPAIDVSEIDLKSPDILKKLPTSVRYACVYWAEHIGRVGEISTTDEARILEFLETHFTHWLESMCLIGMMPHAIKIFDALTSMNMSQKISQLLFDARKFTTNFRLHIEKIPLQIYASALPFAPKKSIIRNIFEFEVPTWITKFPVVQNDWGAFSHNLDAPAYVNSLEVSSDSKLLLAVSSTKQEARLFETSTWRCVLEIDGGNTWGRFAQILFSPDGTRLLGFLESGFARLWHVSDGKCISLDSQGEGVVGVGFSKDGNELVCLLEHRKMLIMNGQTGNLLAKLSHDVDAFPVIITYLMYFNMAVSKNCQLIAIVDREENINIVDRSQGSVVYKYNHGLGDYGRIRHLIFSDDGRFLLSGSTDGQLKAWKSTTGALYEIRTSKKVVGAAFLADSTMVAIVFIDLTVSKWTFQTGGLEDQITDCPGQHMIIFASSRVTLPQIVTCMTSDGNGDTWKNIQNTCAAIKERYPSSNQTISFSPNGKFIACSGSGGVSIWEVSGRDMQGNSVESHDCIDWVKLSPDGNWVASSGRNNLKLWDGNTGKIRKVWVHPSDSCNYYRYSKSFSEDSKTFFFASRQGRIHLWDLVDGQSLGNFQVSMASDPQIALSSDKTLVLLASDNWTETEDGGEGEVILWDLAKNVPLREFRLGTERVEEIQCVAISPDNSIIALSSFGSLLVYNSKGSLLHRLQTEGAVMSSITLKFSADGKFIACGERNITIWVAEAGQKLKEITCGKSVEWISFVDEDRSLLTSEGRFPIASTPANDVAASESGLSLHGFYLRSRQKRFLALIPEFLSVTPSIRGGKAAMAVQPDRISILEIDINANLVI